MSEATGADIEHLGLERGHRTLTITRKGGKVVTIPLAPRTARAIDLAIGERTGGARTPRPADMRTTARRSRRSTCTDTTEPCHDGPHCTVCTDGSVHEPVHGHHSERLTSTTERHHTPRADPPIWRRFLLPGVTGFVTQIWGFCALLMDLIES